MANGYEPGDYLGRFLAQLPQLYRAKQNMDLQRERFEHMKEEGIKDDIYRGQVLTANEERNQLARQKFEQDKIQNTQDEEYRAAALENTEKQQKYNDFTQQYNALKGNREGQELLLKSMFKDNQQMVDTINESRDIEESMQQQVYSLDALTPEQRLLKARQLLTSPYLTKDLYTTLTTIIKGGKDELQFTQQELGQTAAGIEYATKLDQFENPDNYLPASATGAERNAFLTIIGNQLDAIKKEGLAEYKTGFGEYPTYDNIEEIEDDELDTLIADFSAPFTERYPFSPPEESQLNLAGGNLGFPMGDKPDTEKKPLSTKPDVIKDESGLDSLVKEYAPQGSMGILEGAAKEGSVIKPVSNVMFKAIDGGLSTLDSADSTLFTLSKPAVISRHSEKETKRYNEAAVKFKKTLKDMYNLYLRLDPEKGEYQTKYTTGNKMMRKKIREKLEGYKKTADKGKWSPYKYDEEIHSILKQIKF
tara:strand:+ start:199 stop:1629 length:1431 start_codon:yes stop_codon:yes gene_type:complete